MESRLFQDLVVSAQRNRTRPRGGAWPASIGIHALAVSLVISLIPRVTGDTDREAPQGPLVLSANKPAGSPKAAGAPRRAPQPVRLAAKATPFQAVPISPTSTPDVESVLDPASTNETSEAGGPPCLADCVGGGGSNDSLTGPGGDGGTGLPLRPGGDIRPPTKVRHVAPPYPELARRIGVEGVVTIECTIGTDGRVVDARVREGHPLLRSAALEAVQQWLYMPTRLNGVPVAVIMTVTVRFRLSR